MVAILVLQCKCIAMDDDGASRTARKATSTTGTTTDVAPAAGGTLRRGDRMTSRRRRVVVRVVLVLSLLGNAALWVSLSGPKVGAWRSAEGRAAYLTAYDRVMATLPEPAETHDVTTGYGTVRAYLFTTPENATKTPVVLLPGWGSGAPMWQSNLPDLVAERPVYALDALGDAGRSVQSAPLDSAAAQAAWVEEALAELEVEQAHVVGHSFGGWSATNYAVRHPGRVATLSLLEPVVTFSALPLGLVLRSIPSALPFLPQSWREAALADIGGTEEIDPDDPMTAMISAGTQHYASQRSAPSRFDRAQLQRLTAPVYVAMAEESSVTDPATAVENARADLPDGTVTMWSGATHSLPFEKTAEVDAEILAFMAEHDR